MQPCALQLEIMPYESVGSIKFGMTAAQVRARLASHCAELDPALLGPSGVGLSGVSLPDPAALNPAAPIDSFEELGVRVFYDGRGYAEAVELRIPARPVLQGLPLRGQPYRSLEVWFAALDPSVKLEHSGLTSMGLGIRLYAASARRLPQSPVEVVTVFAREFYHQYIASIVPPPG